MPKGYTFCYGAVSLLMMDFVVFVGSFLGSVVEVLVVVDKKPLILQLAMKP